MTRFLGFLLGPQRFALQRMIIGCGFHATGRAAIVVELPGHGARSAGGVVPHSSRARRATPGPSRRGGYITEAPERPDVVPHEIGKAERSGSLEVETAPTVLVPDQQRHTGRLRTVLRKSCGDHASIPASVVDLSTRMQSLAATVIGALIRPGNTRSQPATRGSLRRISSAIFCRRPRGSMQNLTTCEATRPRPTCS